MGIEGRELSYPCADTEPILKKQTVALTKSGKHSQGN